jgi:hypothetical protein
MASHYRLNVRGGLAALADLLFIASPGLSLVKPAPPVLPPELSLYAGSKSCIECHGKFYQLWAGSRQGLALQPYTPEFVQANLTPQAQDLAIGKYRYRADTGQKAGWVLETDPKGRKKKYPGLLSERARRP